MQRLQGPEGSPLHRGRRAAGLVPKVWPGTCRTGNSTCQASARATNGQWSDSICQNKAQRCRGRGTSAPSRSGRLWATPGVLPDRDDARALAASLAAPRLTHLGPRAVLESRAEVLGAPSALAGLAALHGFGGRPSVSEASSKRAAGSHRPRDAGGAGATPGTRGTLGTRRARGRHRGRRGSGSSAVGGGRGARPGLWGRGARRGPWGGGVRRGRGAGRAPAQVHQLRSRCRPAFLPRAGSFRVWPPRARPAARRLSRPAAPLPRPPSGSSQEPPPGQGEQEAPRRRVTEQ